MADAGVTVKEIDLSTRVPSFPGVYGGIVIPARKGPVDTPMLVTSDTDFLKQFTPNERIEVDYDLSYFSALAFLARSNKLWVVRAVNGALSGGVSLRTSVSAYNNFALVAGMADPTAYVFDAGPDVPAVAEVTSVTCVADVSGSLNNQYFFLNEPTGGNGHYVWFNVNSLGTDPGPFGTRTGVEVALPTNASAAAVATAVRAAVDALAAYSAPAPVGAVVLVTNSVAGAVVDATAETSGFTVSVTTQGADAISVTDECLLIYQANPGAWGNDILVKVTRYATNPDKVKEPGAFMIEVFKSANLNVALETFVCSRVPGTRDGFGKNIYVEDVLQASAYIRAFDNPAVDPSVQPKDQLTALALNGGDDGVAVTEGGMISALGNLSSVDSYPLTIVMDGGFATPAYGQALDALAESRGDCVAVLSCPISAEASADFLNEIADYRKTQLNLNSSRSALYSPHVLVYDKFNDRRIFVSPDGYAAAAISYSASNFEIWYPPAGFARGLVRVLDIRRRFDKGQRGFLYDAGVNPFRFTPGKGIAIWGQKTLLSRPSALDRLNVRLMLIVVEPAVAEALDNFTFEFNDAATRSIATSKVSSYMSGVQARRGVTDFLVVCDESNNTPDIIDSNQMYLDLFVKPTKSAEFITFRTIITSSSISFAEAAAAI